MILLFYCTLGVAYIYDTIPITHSQSLPPPTESEYLLYLLRLFSYLCFFYSSLHYTYNRSVLLQSQSLPPPTETYIILTIGLELERTQKNVIKINFSSNFYYTSATKYYSRGSQTSPLHFHICFLMHQWTGDFLVIKDLPI